MAIIKKSPVKKAQYGATRQLGTDAQGRPHPIVENSRKRPVTKSKPVVRSKGDLTSSELDALSHQKRGMGKIDRSYVKKSDPIMNELGMLTDKQEAQLKRHMSKASTAKKIYEALPNVGRIIGRSAADIPKGSQLKQQKKGGVIKKTTSKMKAGGMIKRADGSMSKRGLWDNIRANKGSGKKPTAAMLKQEKKIKAKAKK
jgi:hypothetical protein